MDIVVLVIDSFGIGALDDAAEYGDAGANTILHICENISGKKWPHLKNWGLGNASRLLGNLLPGCLPIEEPLASFGVMKEKSPGKDTTTGHWEMAGLPLKKPFHYFGEEYPSFPETLVKDFVAETGVPGILGNKAASGTRIIAELGDEHLKTKKPICYTSADSVFQIACHKSVYSVKELYHFCEIARKLCDPLNVGRVIARPFDGSSGDFYRTEERHDFSIALHGKTMMDHLQKAGVETIGIGKIGSIFNETGIETSYHDAGNDACLARTMKLIKEKSGRDRLIFVNLVDTDMIYGHRRDVEGYYEAVDKIDSHLPLIRENLNDGDCCFVTADHGCDPTYKGTDHTREHAPLLFFQKGQEGRSLGIRTTFADMGESILKLFKAKPLKKGTSFI